MRIFAYKKRTKNRQRRNSNTETTLSLSSVDTRGSWPINEKICWQTKNKQRTDVSTTESTLILSGSSPDTRGSWPIISHQKCHHPTPSPPSPSTVRSRDHTVLYCTIVLYSTKNEKICWQDGTDNQTIRQTVQRLRPLYPLWILEGVGQ